MDLSKIVAISDLHISDDTTCMWFSIHFQLMDKPMTFEIDYENVYQTEPWVASDGWDTYTETPYSEEYRANAIQELKKFKADYKRLLDAWIKINEISKS